MSSQGVLQPVKNNIRDADGPPFSKCHRNEIMNKISVNTSNFSVTCSTQSQFDILAEMGLGMLEADEDSIGPSSSRIECDQKQFEHMLKEPATDVNTNTDGSPPSKRPRQDTTKSLNVSQNWSLNYSGSGENQLDMLAEMGLGMLDTDADEDTNEASTSKYYFDHNDTNPDLINLPGEYLSSPSKQDQVKETERESTEKRRELINNSKDWEDFCIYRRPQMMKTDGTDWFNRLSDEMALMIFRWLPKISLTRCALVCKRWHRLTSDETLWTRLDCGLKVLEAGSLGSILSRQVIILRLSQAEILEPPILPNVKAFSPDFHSKLMYLDLSMVTATPDCLETLFSKCCRLRKVSLESCTINDNVCLQLSRSEYLEVLNMTMVEGLTTSGIDHLLESCQQLKELNLAWTGLNVDALSYLCVSLPRRLTRLNLAGCRKTLNNTHIRELVSCCPHLIELDLSDGTALNNDAIKYISILKELNFLALSRCYSIHCNAIKELNKMVSLQYLDIHGGHIEKSEIEELQEALGNKVQLNKFMFSSIARPTVGMQRSSIWGLRVDEREENLVGLIRNECHCLRKNGQMISCYKLKIKN